MNSSRLWLPASSFIRFLRWIFLLGIFCTESLPAGTPYVACGPSSHSMYVVDATGAVYAWESNGSGQLGIGSYSNTIVPTLSILPIGIKTWKSMSACFHVLAIADNDQLYAWGNNFFGRLGIGTNGYSTNVPSLIALPPDVTSWKVASAGSAHSLAIANNGALYVWGHSSDGQLGLTPKVDLSMPTFFPFPPGVTNWIEIAAGSGHSLALAGNGQLYAWGKDERGALGGGSVSNAVQLPAGVSKWVTIAAGANQSMALADNGQIYAWGDNFSSRVGDGTTTSVSPYGIFTPTLVTRPIGVSYWKKISAGYYHKLGIGNDDRVYVWGSSGGAVPTLVALPAGVTGWTSVVGGYAHSFGLANNCKLYWFGSFSYDYRPGGSTNSSFPVETTSLSNLCDSVRHTISTGSAQQLTNGLLSFQMTGYEGQSFIIESSTNLSNWTALATNTIVGGKSTWTNNQSGTRSFFRAKPE